MTHSEKANWSKRTDLEAVSIDAKPWEGLAVHSQNSEVHEYVKFALCLLLDEKDRAWDSEVQFPDGRVDVLDFGPDDGNPVVYEVETGVTDKRAREKVEQYLVGNIRDVIVIDPSNVPETIEAATAWLDDNVVVG
jgi:hypothetical protein